MRAAGLLALALLAACAEGAAHEARVLPKQTTHLFMGQDFALTDGVRCHVASAERVLTEPHDESPPVMAEDVLVAKLVLGCSDGRGQSVDVQAALPDDALVQLVDERAVLHAPTARTRVSVQDTRALVFELDETSDVLPRPRRFDASTGLALGVRERGTGSLRLGIGARRIEIVLREPARDARFDRFLAGLVHDLVSSPLPAAGPLAQPAALTQAVTRRLSPRVIALSSVTEQADGLHVTLTFEQSSLPDLPDPVARFTLRVAREGDGFRLVSMLEAEDTARRVACAEALHALGLRVEAAFQGSGPSQPTCNALGVLVPGSCDEAALLAPALETRARCLALPAIGPAPARLRSARAPEGALRPVPDDFQLTLRRGQRSTGLDRDPRYVLALFAKGEVVFHGRHWVSSAGRSDGRSTGDVLAALLARFEELDWFERRGGSWDPALCSPELPLGHVLTLHAQGRERMVVDRDGCRGPFSARELAALIDAVEAAAGVSAWTTPEPLYVARNVQEWTVAGE